MTGNTLWNYFLLSKLCRFIWLKIICFNHLRHKDKPVFVMLDVINPILIWRKDWFIFSQKFFAPSNKEQPKLRETKFLYHPHKYDPLNKQKITSFLTKQPIFEASPVSVVTVGVRGSSCKRQTRLGFVSRPRWNICVQTLSRFKDTCNFFLLFKFVIV